MAEPTRSRALTLFDVTPGWGGCKNRLGQVRSCFEGARLKQIRVGKFSRLATGCLVAESYTARRVFGAKRRERFSREVLSAMAGILWVLGWSEAARNFRPFLVLAERTDGLSVVASAAFRIAAQRKKLGFADHFLEGLWQSKCNWCLVCFNFLRTKHKPVS